MTFTVLFVGSGNVGRSALAPHLAERQLRRIWPKSTSELELLSAGTDAKPGAQVSAAVETVAERRGLDLREHRATALGKELADRADLVLTMSRKQRAQVLLQFPHLRTRTFVLLEFLALLQNAAAVNRRRPVGAGDRLEAKFRLVVATAASRRRILQAPDDERQYDLFDPYAYSLDIHETVAAAIESATHALATDLALITGARGGHGAFRTA